MASTKNVPATLRVLKAFRFGGKNYSPGDSFFPWRVTVNQGQLQTMIANGELGPEGATIPTEPAPPPPERKVTKVAKKKQK